MDDGELTGEAENAAILSGRGHPCSVLGREKGVGSDETSVHAAIGNGVIGSRGRRCAMLHGQISFLLPSFLMEIIWPFS